GWSRSSRCAASVKAEGDNAFHAHFLCVRDGSRQKLLDMAAALRLLRRPGCVKRMVEGAQGKTGALFPVYAFEQAGRDGDQLHLIGIQQLAQTLLLKRR